jgi:5-methylcytosine-specific restriction endonuclease McrA
VSTVAEVVASILAAEQQRAAKREQFDKYKRFYSSRAFRAAAYRFKAAQPKPLRCACCGADSTQTRIVCDHIVPIKDKDGIGWSRRLDVTNFQLLCTDCNLAKASTDQTDWREHPGASEAATCA